MALTNAAPTMTSDVAPSPNVVTQSSYYDSSRIGWKVFDRNSGTYWLTGSGIVDAYVQLDYGSGNGIEIYTISVISSSSNSSHQIKDFEFLGSNNDTDWDTLLTQTGETDWGASETRYFILSSHASYRYYRLHITDNNGSSEAIIGELEFFATAPNPTLGVYRTATEVIHSGSPAAAVDKLAVDVLHSGTKQVIIPQIVAEVLSGGSGFEVEFEQLVTEVLSKTPVSTAEISKAVGYAVLSTPDTGISKALGYAVLSTEVSVGISKAVGYAVLEPAPSLAQVHQLVSEVVTTGDPKTNLNQLVAEVVTTGDPVLQTHQLAVEVVWKPVLDGEVQNHQFVLEVMDTGSPEVAVQQFVLEVMDTGSPEVAVQQFVTEVMQLSEGTYSTRKPIVFICT